MSQRINTGESVQFKICAIEPSSNQKLEVTAGEKYLFKCDKSQTWYDKSNPSPPTGYPNFLAKLFGMRIKDKPCFCLCGLYNETEGTGFVIGLEHEEPVSTTGSISFFANDTKWLNFYFYKNNSGSVLLDITRLE